MEYDSSYHGVPLRPANWECFAQGLQLLASNSSALRYSKSITADALLQLASDTSRVISHELKTSSHQQFHSVMASGSLISSSGQSQGATHSALWLPIDLYFEDTMDGSQVVAISATETLMGTFDFALKTV